MRKLVTEFTPEECVRILRMSIRQEWGSYERVRGWVIGRTFRLVLQEHIPSHDPEGAIVGCVIYGRIRSEGSGSVIDVREFARALDPGLWLMTLPLAILPFFYWKAPPSAKLMLLLFIVVGYVSVPLMYRWREAEYKAMVRNLRWFLRKSLDAKEVE